VERNTTVEEQFDNPGGSAPAAAQVPTDSPFLKNAWYVAGWCSEFASAGPFTRTIINEPLVLYRRRVGELTALQDRCAHRWAPLSLGRIEGDDLRCMYHGLKFGPDGRCLQVPGQDRIGRSLSVRVFPVVERHRFAWVWMGDPVRADPQQIPDLGALDQSWRRIYHGSLDYAAHYSLICDNLLDLSHIAFLHEKTLGRPVAPPSATRVRPRIPGGASAKPAEGGVRVEGWLSGKSVFLPKNVPDGDFWSRVDFLAPGIYFSQGRMYAEGAAEEFHGLAPDEQRVPFCDGVSIQAVTPMTVRKTRYFYSIGNRNSDMKQEEADSIWRIVLEAFNEDLHMIEAQQRVIDEHPGGRMAGIEADRGVVLFRDLMKKLIASEA
jgi:phenylpropionate dioxygenase-like ring-hydroxylating dioxygenase large terminal subunit